MLERFVLDNGIRVLSYPKTDGGAVTVLVLVEVGSKYEKKEMNGITHFLEHLMFKGTKKRPNTFDIAKELDAIGAEYNAFTTKEYTGYFIKGSARHTELFFDILSDMLLNSKLNQEEIEKERGVILQEMYMYQDTPTRYISDLFEKLLYGDTPAGWMIVGEKDTVTRLNQKDFKDYLSTYYVGPKIIISAAGEIENGVIKELSQEYFSSFSKNHAPDKDRAKEDDQKQLETFYKKTDQTHLILGVPAYDIFDERKYALGVLANILGGSMSSRLFINLREKKGLAYYVKTGAESYSDSGYLATAAGVDNKKVEESIKIILNEYKSIRENGVEEEELKRSKDGIKGRMMLSLETSDDYAEFFGGQELLERKILTAEEIFVKIDKVSVNDIKEVANDVFAPHKVNLAIIGQHEQNKWFKKLTSQLQHF